MNGRHGGASFFDRLQTITESVLSRRRAIQRIRKEKQRKKNPLFDWIEAFIWAAGVVLLINQYLFQAYQIPSGSMIDTLLEQDRIFVNKLIYGPELLPGVGKLPSPVKPQREDVVIFESPEYFSQGPLFDIAQRIIYMLTLSQVDIDRDPAGRVRVHFLIKRAAGMEGDQIQSRRGELYFCFAGENRWISEREYLAQRGFTHRLTRLVEDQHYPALEAMGKTEAYMELGLTPPPELMQRAGAYELRYGDSFVRQRARYSFIRGAYPQDQRYRVQAVRQGNWYVPEGRIMPLGDNRDNSHDGRFFGTVQVSKILGRGAIKYWPPGRIGIIR
ncbi:MAG: signal peptidase I [Spirochaetaceae bacterium]|jgi:signal peptidase I|nr:signal peptidase I [Spirochaetaceae bacterium]